MSLHHSPRIVTDGLVLYLDAANTKSYPGSGISILDLSGNGNHGTLSRAEIGTTNSKIMTFVPANTDSIIIPSTTIPLNGGTMEMMVYLNTKDRNQGFFQVVNTPKYINFYMNNGNCMRWEVINDTSQSYATINSTTVFTTGRWYHVLGTFNGTNTTTIYINGISENTQTDMINQPSTMTTSIIIGQYAGYCSANIAFARFYNRALTPIEILQNYNALKGRFGL